MPTSTSSTSTLDFLRALYPVPLSELGGQLAVWSLSPETKRSRTDWVADLGAADGVAKRLRSTMDVYFGVALQDPALALELARRKRPNATLRRVRGHAESARAIPAVWVDLDVASGVHTSSTLPPDAESALGLLPAIPVAPSAIVGSGGGLHVYWVLDDPWILDGEDDRLGAASLLRRVQWALRREAEAHGWTIDPTADLARVLRLPGPSTTRRRRRGRSRW